VAFPGPSLPAWGLGLVALAIAVAVLGELVRRVGQRWLPLLRTPDPIERGLLDLYLGGGVFYVLAAVPLPLFYPWTVSAVLLLGVLGLVLLRGRASERAQARDGIARLLAPLRRLEYIATLLAVLTLFIIELWATAGIGSGNTYDSSLLSTYTALLLAHHTLPLSLAPVANQGLTYPQGTTVWLAVAQCLFGLPPLRTTLLVTPLFLSIAPLGAFAVGRRLGGSATTGAAFALVLALLAAGSREMVGGSNDFVFALPLVLLLAAWSVDWISSGPLAWSDAIAFGGLAGYAASLNPVGPVWLLLVLPVGALLARPAFGGAPTRWMSRWLLALGAALVALLPTLYALARYPSSAGVGDSVGSATVPTGETTAKFVGYIDPFLFGPQDQSLSAFPLLRAELAVLLVAGLILLVVARSRFPVAGELGRFAVAAGLVAVILLGLGVLADAGIFPFPALFRILSASELSILLFVDYALVASVPLAVAFAELRRSTSPAEAPRLHRATGSHLASTALPFLAAAIILVPGIAASIGELPGELHQGYATFSNLTQADVDFLEWAPTHLPSGSRVVVAPGSAAGFLPSYDPEVDLLYPMTVGFLHSEPEYWAFVDGLQNGSYDSSALADLYGDNFGWTHPFYVAVTENNTALFRPMQPDPLLAAMFPVAFQEAGVYLFVISGFPPPEATNLGGR
jgi:hypothetical protein